MTASPPPPASKKRRRLVVVALVVVAGALFALIYRPFPKVDTPAGAYTRIAKSIAEDDPQGAFPFLEEDGRWASYTIRDMRRKACDRIRRSYPPGKERDGLLAAYSAEANAPDGADVFALLARKRGWVARLRKDLSGVRSVEIEGPRATVVTARGTHYSFRRRDNGIWGLTLFTADLVAESERASRDLESVRASADDYDRAAGRAVPPRDGGGGG